MRQRDEDLLTMSDVTLKVLNDYKTQWQDHTPVAEITASITEAVADIKASRKVTANMTSTGATKDKATAAADAIDLAVELAGYAQVYARRQQNHTLLDQVTVKRRTLETTDDNALVDVLEALYERLTALGGSAEPYGVTAEKLARLKQAIAVYKPLKDAPRNTIVTRKGKRSSEPALLTLIRNDWKDLDLLMPVFEVTAPQLVTDYRNARIIINRGSGGKQETEAKGNQ